MTALTRLTVAGVQGSCWLLALAVAAAGGQAPLAIHVAYPAAHAALDVGDSTFVFGSVTDGRATLTVAGVPVTVAPGGGWLAWIAVPRDSSFVLKIVAHAARDSAILSLPLSRAGWVREIGAWVDPGSRSPVGNVWLPRGEALSMSVRAAPGATVRLLFGNGKVLRFAADSMAPAVREGVRAFDHDERNLHGSPARDQYVATLLSDVAPLGNAAAFVDTTATANVRAPALPVLEVSLRGKVTRTPWPIHVTRTVVPPIAVYLDDDSGHRGGTDRVTIGRAYPDGTYTWFFPTGTRAQADMRINDRVRLRLSRDAIAWVPIADVQRGAAADDSRIAIMGSPTLTADGGRVRLRVPLTRAVPHTVDETERGLTITLFDAVSNANWTRYGADDRFVQLLSWRQEREDRVTLSLTFDRPLWGWRVRVDGNDLVFEFREPPDLDATNPVRGRRIVIDPGHPPGGACGPTGLCEPEANLNIAMAVRDQLVAAGATVFMTRAGPGDVELWPRVAFADSLDADLLVSIHNNAFPDGINPFTNGGTSTFFNHPQSLGLARAVQSRLVANLGLRDLGVARGDLALARPTWYPAILTEGFHMMFPEQEALLRTVEGRGRYATGIVEGITMFLHSARHGTSGQ